MYTLVRKSKGNKKESLVNSVAQNKEFKRQEVEFRDNRDKAVSQRNFKEIANGSLKTKQTIQSQTISKNLAASPFTVIPGQLKATRPEILQNKEVIQAKMFFVPNKHYLFDPDDLNQFQVDQYQQWFVAAVNALPDTADAATARGAVDAEFSHRQLNAVYHLYWNGNTVSLQDTTGRRLEDLGEVMDEQNNNLYFTHNVGVGRNIYVNRSNRTQSVQDSSGQYMERFINRSITGGELTALRNQNNLQAPNAHNRTLLQHVTGYNDGNYVSYSTSPNDVMNAQGTMFNAQGRGRIRVDLAQINSNNIHNLSTRAGIRANLAPSLGQYGRNNIDQILTDAQTRANLEIAAGASPNLVQGDQGNSRAQQTAGRSNPHTNANLPNSHFQAITDAFRTKEVLLEGNVPFNAVVNYGSNSGAHNIGVVAPGAITQNDTNSQALTTAADQALTNAEQIPAVALADGYNAAFQNARNRLIGAMNSSFKNNKARGDKQAVSNRNRTFRRSLKTGLGIFITEAQQISTIYQRRNAAGWANSLPVNLTARLQNLLAYARLQLNAIVPPN